jgi:hypothetical protein
VYTFPTEKSVYFDNEIFDELENDIVSFAGRGNVMILGDFSQLFVFPLFGV